MVKLARYLLGVFLLATILIACSSFTHRFYGLRGVSYKDGKLLGPKEDDDLPFSKCAPSSQRKNPCIVLFSDDFYELKKEYEDMADKLKACEKK